MNQEDIYSTVPEEAFLQKCEEPEHRRPILEFLQYNTGKFFTAKQIAKECGFPTTGTQVEVRKAITLLLEIDKQPIMSMVRGYGYVTTRSQMNFYADALEERLKGLLRRIQVVREIALDLEDPEWN